MGDLGPLRRMTDRNNKSLGVCERLLPCPFCGFDIIRVLPQSYGYSVNCENCYAKKDVHSHVSESVSDAWNQRPDTTAPEGGQK